MLLKPGVRIGPLEVQSLLGVGGMGEVYKARDTRLDRAVAIKVLAARMASDPDLRDRFDREARAISSLNHPNICALYDVGRHEGIDFVVMEYLDGETLADRIARGPLLVEEALRVAGQVARALESAHESGIIHRDVKPGNVMITAGGHVKVLDFGLAKRNTSPAGGSGVSDASTMMATTPGLILGTAAYMPPEQATGAEVDRTADMWAFGCVLFEMLAGRRAFEGGTTSETLASVLKSDPDWRRLPPETPERILRLLRRALKKDPNARFRDMRDARLEIDDVQDAPVVRDHARAPSRGRERMAWASVVAVLALVAGVLGARALRPAPTTPEVRLEVNTPPTRSASLAVSPDGRQVIFVAQFEGHPQLWIRSLDSSAARPLPGTDHATGPFWSPDGRSIGFFAESKLKRVDIEGGAPVTLAAAGVPLGGTWSMNDTILFSNSPGGPIVRIPSGGGVPTAATQVDSTQRGHWFPQFLPDGKHFLFFTTGTPEARGVYVGQLDSVNTTRLFGSDSPATYASTGHLLFVRDGKLLAQSFDALGMTVARVPVPVADNVGPGTVVSASAAGPIVYRTPPPDGGQRQLTWLDRSGQELSRVVYPDTAALGPSLSWDGRRIAVYREVNGNMDIWSYDISRRSWDRVTSDPGDDIYPLWSRDGTSLVFAAVRNQGVMDFYRRLLGAPQASEDVVFSSPFGKFPTDLSADGQFLLYDTLFDPRRGSDIMAVPLAGDRKSFEVVATDFHESQAQFSPSGKWIAYQSDKTGRNEIYLRPFRGSGADVRVSIDGGGQPRWNRNGEELFFIGADDRMMAVRVRITPDGKRAEPGTPVGLFATDVGSTALLLFRQQYMVSPDGQSFILNSAVAEANSSPIMVILNWRP